MSIFYRRKTEEERKNFHSKFSFNDYSTYARFIFGPSPIETGAFKKDRKIGFVQKDRKIGLNKKIEKLYCTKRSKIGLHKKLEKLDCTNPFLKQNSGLHTLFKNQFGIASKYHLPNSIYVSTEKL
jgi:hypothetical protein